MNIKSFKLLEWCGVLTAIIYTLLIAFNIGAELIAFSLLFISAIFLSIWSYGKNYKAILILQIFYASAALFGFFRWFE